MDTTSELTGLFLHCLFNAERQAGNLWIPTFISTMVWLEEKIEPRFINYEADAWTTRPCNYKTWCQHQ